MSWRDIISLVNTWLTRSFDLRFDTLSRGKKQGAKNAKHIKSLEEQTGVNLDHYYKLKIA